ncbi:dicarboxylate/amino acid:cation symporter [uncultured Anaerococcus sp.]|uniref:dicarboxylate/amino acid:cation symporter n=1 Tax=uncultured Anaerococcus sp. TaxID=293428 RepID=UPI00260CF872|nr:dicarboxylate/amino acid:cation symporter [uncultured Anaerococcus sp.]
MKDKTNNKKMSSTKKILLSMLIGLVVGLILHYILPSGYFKQTVLIDGVFFLLGQGFVRMLQMLVVPLVFFSITSGVMQMKDISQFGRVAVRTLVLYAVTTAIGIIFAFLMSNIIKQGIGMSLSGISKPEIDTEQAPTLIETLVNIIPKNPIEAMANGDMLQIIFWAFITGIVCGKYTGELQLFVDFIQTGNNFMMKVTALVMKVAPLGVFALIARTFTDVGLGIVGPLLKFLLAVLASMLLLMLVVYLPLISFSSKAGPKQFFKKVLPVYTFAFSSASSNAAIPLTLSSCDALGVPREISSFTIPLGATINMNGTAIYQGCAVIFIANAFGIGLTTADLITVVLTAVLSSIGTAGVPGSGMIMLSMVLTSVGLPVEGVSLIMSVERIVDMFRTALNVTGDVVATFISATQEKLLDKERYLSDEIPSMESIEM